MTEVDDWVAMFSSGAPDYAAWYARAERARANAEIDFLKAASARLPAQQADQAALALALIPRVEAAIATVERLLATPPPKPRYHGERIWPDAHARLRAAELAQCGDDDLLYRTIAHFGLRTQLVDLFALWAHELVLRGANLGGPQIDELADTLVRSRHLFAGLPMHRLGLERAAPLHPSHHSITVCGTWGSTHPTGEPVPAREVPASIVDITTSSDARIGSIFESHTKVSNGRFEARVFALEPASPGPPHEALLRALPLACLKDASRVTTIAIDAAMAFGLLLSFGASGGDYNQYWSGAHGRYHAWRSLGGLAGAPLDATLHDIEQRAARTSFTCFSSDAPWFEQVVTDLGIAAIDETGMSISVLAGTDTD